MDNRLKELMADLKEQETLTRVKELIDTGTDPLVILASARAAMEIVTSGLKLTSTSFRIWSCR